MRGDHPAPQPRRLNQFGRHDPPGWLLEQRRSGEHREFRVAGTEILVARAFFQADVGQQAGQQSLVYLVCLGWFLVDGEAKAAGDLAQLAVQILPFPDPEIIEELGTTEFAKPVAGQFLLLFAQVLPQVQETGEVGVRIGEAGVLLGGLGLGVGRALSRVLNGQCGGDDEYLTQAAVRVRRHDHPGEAGIDRQPGELAAEVGEALALVANVRVQGAEFLEQLHAIGDVAAVRRVDERERGQVAQAQRGHLQDHRREIGAQDLRIV